MDPFQLGRNLFWRQNKIYTPGSDGATGHAIVLCRSRRLGEGDSTFPLDILQAQGAIGSCAGKDDSDCAALPLFRGERMKKLTVKC